MIVSEICDINQQIRLLIHSGWYQEAAVIAQVSHECGAICATSLGEHAQSIESKIEDKEDKEDKQVGINGRHQLFGVDSNARSESVLSTLQFTRLTDYEDMKRAFKQAVNRIEVETSTQCNRRCTYCPVSELPDRQKKNDFMDFDLYMKLLQDLQQIDYTGEFVLVGMNEFFMHEENFKYLEPIRHHLPHAQIAIYSNGDYVDRCMFDRASQMGLDRLVVSFHPAPNKPFSAEDILDRAQKFTARTGVALTLDLYKSNERLHFIGQKGSTTVYAGLVNWGSVGHNWGGTVETKRDGVADNVPCNAPVRSFIVCKSGDIAICGAVPRERTALTEEHGAITGNIRDFESAFHAYADDAALWWRQHAFSTTELPELCRTCSARSAGHNSANIQMANLVETNCAKIARQVRASKAA